MNYRMLLLALVLGAPWFGPLAFAGDPPCCATGETQSAGAVKAQADLVTKWGIEVASLRMTAGDRMVDFRYKVVDPVKAAVLGQRESQAYLIDQSTGTKLRVPSSPKIGPLRARADKPLAGTVYVVLFGNAAKVVRSGSLVTVEIGQVRIADLKVD